MCKKMREDITVDELNRIFCGNVTFEEVDGLVWYIGIQCKSAKGYETPIEAVRAYMEEIGL